MTKKTVSQWISNALSPQNIIAVVALFFAGSLSYGHFKNDIEYRVKALEQNLDEQRKLLPAQKRFRQRIAKQLDYVCERQLDCPSRYDPIEAPH